MTKLQQIFVKGSAIALFSKNTEEYISLTDMIKRFGDEALIYQWMRNRNTVEFLGIWETLYNPNFKGTEFDTFKKLAGLHNFTLTPKKWLAHAYLN